MNAANVSAFDLHATHVQLTDGPAAKRAPLTPDFWRTPDSNPELRGGRLVTAAHVTRHHARVHEPSEIWFVTYGEGTQHRGV